MRFDGDRGIPVTPSPALGEHTGDVLRTLLGLSDDRIRELRDNSVI